MFILTGRAIICESRVYHSMKNTEIETADCGPINELCAGRRQFLTRSVAGGLAIALGGASVVTAARAADEEPAEAEVPVPNAKDYELVVKPSEHPELEKVGGYVILETKVGKITVARVSETQFSVVGAVCTHKGGPINYDADTKQFFCPWHKSRFELDGAVAKGPAKEALPNYKEETAAVIKLS